MTIASAFDLRHTMSGLALGLAVLGTSRPAAADSILAENSAVGSRDGVATYSTGGIGAENFTLGSAFNITRISHVGLNNAFQPTSVDWWIYADAGGTPTPGGTSLFSGTAGFGTYVLTNEGGAGNGYDLFRYEIPLTGVTLPAGDYWVGFRNNGDNDGPYWAYATGGTSMDGISAGSPNNGATWSTPYTFGNDGNVAFRVSGNAADEVGAVPLPPTAWGGLALFGAAGLMNLRRRAGSAQP